MVATLRGLAGIAESSGGSFTSFRARRDSFVIQKDQTTSEYRCSA
jgi:hypothetical protein